MGRWLSLHTHSQFSALDGMSPVPDLVAKAAAMGQPGLGLTDHGNMAGTVQLYKACKQAGILAFPGVEAYLADPTADDPMHSSTRRFHVGLLARDFTGYKALVRYSSLSHTRPRFSKFPRLLISDLADMGREFGDHLLLLTGCYFGLAQQRLEQDGVDAAERVVKAFATWFPHTFVEVQNHGITRGNGEFRSHTDDDIVGVLVDIADRHGMPVIATQDSHYVDQRQRAAHALMKRMVYGGAEDEFPGDSFHLASEDWVSAHYDPKVWRRVEQACDEVVRLNEFTFPALDNYTPRVPVVEKRDPDAKLRVLVAAALDDYTGTLTGRRKARYRQRCAEELQVINELGYANYFLLVRKVVRWCDRNNVCVEARGSANASLVCLLLGITQIDPIKWDLLFERFISRDRIKPPDVDLDVEDARRGDLLAYLAKTLPTVQIGTWSRLGESKDTGGEDSGRGSVLVTYLGYLRRRSEQLAADHAAGKGWTKSATAAYAKRIFGRRFSFVQSIEDIRQISRTDHRGLRELARMRSVYRSYGVHAAGVLLGTADFPIHELVPTMLVASSETVVTQYGMDDLDDLGLLKLDVLGQSTLTVMRRCQDAIGRPDPTDFAWIPEDDKAACRLLREGRPDNGVFHFEGYTKARGGKEMGITSTRDTVLASALYMPGAMDSGQKDQYLRYRQKPWLRPKYLHPIFKRVLSPTHGAVIFQDQPLAILRALGMSIKNINVMFTVVKDSGKGAAQRNAERMRELRKEFNYLCVKAGINNTDEAWHLVTGFIVYGFNKPHATGYGLRSYRCAYLKAHHPLEFITALLAVWAEKGNNGTRKEILYAREARRLGIRLLPPDVNVSGPTWTLDPRRRAIRRGLVSIPGIGPAAAEEIAAKAPYRSVDDLLDRCSGRAVSGKQVWVKDQTMTGKLLALFDAGALDSIT